jgi:hypothetical protein
MRERTELWGGNRETWRDVLFSRDSLFVYTLRTHRGKRKRYEQRLARYEMVGCGPRARRSPGLPDPGG